MNNIITLNDQVKALADRAHQDGSTTPERIFHINFVVAQELLQKAIANNCDHKAAYQHVKQGIEAFANAGVKFVEAA
jgi:hypothetical protein